MAGQIVKRGDNTWQIRVFLGRDQVSGKRQFFTKTIHGRKRDAQEFLTRTLRERDTDSLVLPSKQSVGEWLDQWMSLFKNDISARTRQDYQSIIDRHIRPKLGGIRLDQLSSITIQRFCNEHAENPRRGPRTVKYIRDVLGMAMREAVRQRILQRDPTQGVKVPRIERRHVDSFLTAEQAAVFCQAAEGSRWGALWLLLLTAGLRPGEALALRWKDVDLENQQLAVNRSLSRLEGQAAEFKEPKTRQSQRSVALAKSVVKALKGHRAYQASERLRAGKEYKDQDLVFATAVGSPLDYRNLIQRYFKPLLKHNSLPPIRPYDLRHTAASLAMSLGTPIKVVSEQLGHSSIKMTLDVYSHLQPNMQREAADRLDAFLSRKTASRKV